MQINKTSTSRGVYVSSIDSATERFNETNVWSELLKVGKWDRDESGKITGKGMHTYLLSRASYGPRFSLRTIIRFLECHPVNRLDAVNAGIVIGWTTPRTVRRYFNILFTGEELLLELVGGKGGGSYEDFEHLDKGVAMPLNEGLEYSINVVVSDCQLQVNIETERENFRYEFVLPEFISGRVGLRPWRSRMVCDEFLVRKI